MSASGEGAGQSIDFSGGLVVTADNAYIEYNDQAYEVGAEQFTQLREQFEAQARRPRAARARPRARSRSSARPRSSRPAATPAACDFDPASWLTNLTNEGTEDVGGTDTIHIAGDANVDQILTDVGELASSVPGAEAQGFDPAQLGAGLVGRHRRLDQRLLGRRRQGPAQARGST